MPSQQLDAVLVKTSLVDYPARVAAACFLRGCNLRCPYCYNTELVAPQKPSQDLNAAYDNRSQAQDGGARRPNDQPQFVSIQDVIAHLKKRANVLSGFVISGGEPLCHPDAVRDLIMQARSLGYKIKLDTNGTFPDRLQKLLDDSAARPDYIALDVKTSPARYQELSQARVPQETSQAQEAAATPAQKIIDSIKIVSSLAADAREFRTVLFPPLVARAEIEQIAALLPKDASWFFARFMNGHCLSAAAQNVAPYSDDETKALVDLARATIPGAIIR